MPTTDRAPRRGGFAAVVGLVVLSIFAGVGYLVWTGAGPLPDPEGCRVTVGDVEVELSTEQAENATIITSVALQRRLPARAVSIALATAYQESKLQNIDYGDRDSVGLFQQRPSQGWGTVEQIMRPTYSAGKFFDALVEVEGYQEMRITEAAQAVQRSGFPEAYEDHADGARALASALTGYDRAKMFCVVDGHDEGGDEVNELGLTARADAVRRDVVEVFGDLPLGGYAPEGVSTGHIEGSKHYTGRAVDIFFRPINAANKREGWAVAQYLVAHAKRLKIATLIFDGRIWTAGSRSEQGWREYDAPDRPGDRAILEHRDHIHVDVD